MVAGAVADADAETLLLGALLDVGVGCWFIDPPEVTALISFFWLFMTFEDEAFMPRVLSATSLAKVPAVLAPGGTEAAAPDGLFIVFFNDCMILV